MRKVKTFKIDDREVTVKELRVKDVVRIIEMAGGKEIEMDNLAALAKDVLPLGCDIDVDALWGMAPSEIKEVWDNFREVNAVFFEMAQAAGLGEVVESLKKSIKEDFGKMFADLSNPAMQTPGDTDSASS